jgi:hypothetical protein
MNPLATITTSVEQDMLDRVYQHIASQPIDNNVTLLGGQMGYALFESYYQNHKQQPDNEGRIWDRVVTSLNAIQEGGQSYSFAGGIAGIAWGFLHLCNHGLIQPDDLDANDIVADLDEPLFQVSMELLQKGDYDYLHGGLSAGLYFLERQPSAAISHYIDTFVEQLSATAIRFPNGDITWPFHDFNRRTPDRPVDYNLGLSHGTASIVAMLRLFYEGGYARKRCAELISGTLQWMWNSRNRTGNSLFPTAVGAIRKDDESRLGWCYGDLGIACAFWQAGQTLNNPSWRAIGEQTILKAAQRRSMNDTKVADAAICHGSAGVAYIFRRFAQRIPNPSLTQAADYWLQETARHASADNEENVFLSYYAPSQTYEVNLGILDGEASVGLALLAELGALAYWDRFLLLS